MPELIAVALLALLLGGVVGWLAARRKADGLAAELATATTRAAEVEPLRAARDAAERDRSEALQALAHVLPDARHISLPDVGHWPQLEDPDAFDGALLDFLATARARVLH